jgi:lysophospholipase
VGVLNCSHLTAHDGLRLRCGLWRPDGPPLRGAMVLLGGRGEFLEKYDETAAALNRRGYVVHGLDWRGQGLSGRLLPQRRKGHVADYGDYLADLALFIRRRVMATGGGPLRLLAHSMGAHIALRWMHDDPGPIAAAVMVSPMIALFDHPPQRWLARGLAEAALACGLGRCDLPGNGRREEAQALFAGNPLTSDRRRFQRQAGLLRQMPALAIHGPTFGWLAATLRSIARLQSPGFAEAIDRPVLIIGAGEDRVVSVAAQERFCRRLPRGEWVCISTAKHEILQESDPLQAVFWQHFDRFAGASA